MFRCSGLVAVFLMTLSCITQTQALIVPQELPSILSLVYSNIPPIKKGTDSRLGFGFRLGEHADFQVVVELGPQKDTRPLGMDDGSSSKRQVNQKDFYKPQKSEESTTAGSWLQNWSNDMHAKKRKPTKNHQKQHNPENEITKNGYMKTNPMIPESSLKQLQQLYKMAATERKPIVVEDISAPPAAQPIDMMSIISPRHRQATQIRKTKGEITEELMDVKME